MKEECRYKIGDGVLVRTREWDMGLVYEAWVPEKGGWIRSEYAADVMCGCESGDSITEEQAKKWMAANPVRSK